MCGHRRTSYVFTALICFVTVVLFLIAPYQPHGRLVGIMADHLFVFSSTRVPAYTPRHDKNSDNTTISHESNEFLRRILALQDQRKSQLRLTCQGMGSTVYGKVGPESAWHLFNIRSLGIAYFSMPKCASTVLKGFFERISGIDCGSDNVEHSCADKHLRARAMPENFLLLVVRNPWTRLVSSYVDKFVIERHPLTRDCYAYHGMNRYGIAVSFTQFVECILHQHSIKKPIDHHVAPMHWMRSHCQRSYSYIAKVETLSDDFRYLASYVFPKAFSPDQYEQVFSEGYRRPNENTNATLRLYEQLYKSLDKKALSALVKIYGPDARLFGYPETPI